MLSVEKVESRVWPQNFSGSSFNREADIRFNPVPSGQIPKLLRDIANMGIHVVLNIMLEVQSPQVLQ